MGQMVVQLLDLVAQGLAPAGEQLVRDEVASIDWSQAYHDDPQLLMMMAERFGRAIPTALPSHEDTLRSAVRHTIDQIKRVMTRVDGLTDSHTGLLPDAALQTTELQGVMDDVLPNIWRFVIELKVATDQVFTVITWKTTMCELLASVEAGDDVALLKTLSVNPFLAYHAAVGRRLQQATAFGEHRFLRQIQRAIARRPRHYSKARAGLLIAILWEGGVKRLSYQQIHEFLRAVGLHQVPSAQALERCGQRLGLKKYCIELQKERGEDEYTPGEAPYAS